jgi:hypothetical protein
MSPRIRFGLAVAILLVSFAIAPGAQRAGGSAPPINGISCDAMEGQRLHIHQHLSIVNNGKPITIPPTIGQRMGERCLYWLHTHTPDGILHIEAPLDRTFTLGDFFAVWGMPLSKTQAANVTAPKGTELTIWVNGKKYLDDPSKIALTAHADIVIQAGKPNDKPKPFTAWGSL